MAVSANLVISFGDEEAGADAHLSAEIDGRPNGLNGGKTSFAPGDAAWFLVYKSSNVTYDDPISSAGTIEQGDQGLEVEKEDDLEFPDTDTARLSIPAQSIVSTTWLGRSLGDLTLQDDKVTLKASSKGVAVCRLRYKCRGDAWKLQSPTSLGGLTDFSILVYILGHVN